jgi:hypothetical protein
MGKFEEKAAGKSLPADVPKAAESAREHPDGAIYTSDGGTRFRLRHAHWVEIVPRQAREEKPKAAAKK